MRMPASLEKMSFAQLEELRNQVDRAMSDRQEEAKTNLRAEFAEKARDAGLSLDEVLGLRRRGGGRVAPKYRDPQNAQNTWTGRGRMPIWMRDAMKKGRKKRDDFLI